MTVVKGSYFNLSKVFSLSLQNNKLPVSYLHARLSPRMILSPCLRLSDPPGTDAYILVDQIAEAQSNKTQMSVKTKIDLTEFRCH